MALRILLFTLFLLYCKANAASQQGTVGLWSDSECNSKSGTTSNFGEPDPIALNFDLEPDVCGVPGATVHSYRVRQKAFCANGTTANFYYYNSKNCTRDPTDEDPNPGLLAKRGINRRQFGSVLDGECMALIAFNSLAFVCDGVSPRNVKVNTLSVSASSSTVPSVSSSLTSSSSSYHLATATSAPATNSSTSNSSATISSTLKSSATISSTTNSSATVSSATNSSATISSTRSSPTTSSPATKSSVSAGTSTAAGVGSVVGVLAIACSVFFLLWHI